MWVNGERKGEVAGSYRSATQMASANGFRNALRDHSGAADGSDRCDLERVAAALSVALQQLGSFGQTGQPTPAQASRRNKKPGAASRPGMIRTSGSCVCYTRFV